MEEVPLPTMVVQRQLPPPLGQGYNFFYDCFIDFNYDNKLYDCDDHDY